MSKARHTSWKHKCEDKNTLHSCERTQSVAQWRVCQQQQQVRGQAGSFQHALVWARLEQAAHQNYHETQRPQRHQS
jgi:hypothetical protein